MKNKYDGTEAIIKGNCGYEGCKNKLRSRNDSSDDESPVISCDLHDQTYWHGYSYLDERECQTMYNAVEVRFSENLDNAHECFHGDDEPDCKRGGVVGENGSFIEATRECGAWNSAAPRNITVKPLGWFQTRPQSRRVSESAEITAHKLTIIRADHRP